jgi:hypothetical protein
MQIYHYNVLKTTVPHQQPCNLRKRKNKQKEWQHATKPLMSGSALACWKRRVAIPESPVVVMVRPVSIFWKYNRNPVFGYGSGNA